MRRARRFNRLWWVAAAVAGACVGAPGCDRAPAPEAATPPSSANVAPITSPVLNDPAATQPADAPRRPQVVMIVDDQPREFPAPRLVLSERDGRTVALLMSDDPPDAIDDDYVGNSYYLEMRFDEAISTLRGVEWVYEAPSTDRLDSPSGIFLQGNRKQLQPFRLKVRFESNAGEDVAWISGTFYEFTEPDPVNSPTRAPPPRLVPVAGRLVVTLP